MVELWMVKRTMQLVLFKYGAGTYSWEQSVVDKYVRGPVCLWTILFVDPSVCRSCNQAVSSRVSPFTMLVVGGVVVEGGGVINSYRKSPPGLSGGSKWGR